ncbi:zinc metalloproteinase-disintegrin-like crotastatin isoform X1 [Hemiscyllium ocellatum]|uniref:zinc metalloproteinase-disintegrin-like crotastatin isoform X1 n=1 Tax=Hemiscyllium ocellatum TaxID=170820 RepID=UPI002965EAC0|nr:zinc metalloproteinase-disintegrin-like crotastatin isoform X1 [Hemiscyllium ocellatum]
MVHPSSLVHFLLLCSVAAEFAILAASKLPDVQNYQVVIPRRLHTKHRRTSEGLHPSVIQFEVPVDGKEQVVHLEKNEQLIANNYSETYYLKDGTEVTSNPLYPDHCYYHGYIKGEGGSSASFSTCEGFSGYLHTNGQRYVLEPLKGSDKDEHALYLYEELRLPLKTCGVVNTSEDSLEPRVEETFNSPRERNNFLREKKYIEMYVVADNSEYRHFRSVEAVRSRVFEAVNHINLLYQPLRTHVALIGLEIWSSGDQFFVEKDAGRTLTNMLEWRRTKLLPRKEHDNIQFITHVDFTGDTIGLAQVSAMCTHGSGAINQDHTNNVHGVASTIAHEMGHNLGMNHDDDNCNCDSRSCIMSPVLSSVLPTEFSSCSHQHFQNFVLTRTASCLRDVPNQDEIVSRPVCGNRFLEKGEECDCGIPEECLNPCCDAETCRLREGVQCADGTCCKDCKFMAAGLLCRRAKDDCDLEETCDGRSGQCPEDTFRLNGTPCKRNTSFCYNGKCPTHQEQCVSFWGSGAKAAPRRCFEVNKQGDKFGYCQKTAFGYQGCASEDIMCGQLSCTGGNKQPRYSTGSIRIGSTVCQVVLDPVSLVQNGTKCGDNKMCVNSRCTKVPLVDECSRKCPTESVCNHLLQCQLKQGSSSSPDSGLPTYAIIIIVLAITLLITIAFGAAAFAYRKHTRKPTVTARTPHTQTSGLSNPAFTDSAPVTPRVMRPQMPKGPAMVTVPPPAYNTVLSAPFPPRQAPPPRPLGSSDKPHVPRAPPKPPGMKPPQPPSSKVLMPPTTPRN